MLHNLECDEHQAIKMKDRNSPKGDAGVSTERTAISDDEDVANSRDTRSQITTERGLSWEQITFTAVTTNGKTKKNLSILKGVSGVAPAGQLTAVLGHSGAGKTSLLGILAGRIKSSRQAKIRGSIGINGKKVNPAVLLAKHDLRLAFVQQTDSLLPHITPREAFRFSARLRLAKQVTEEEIAGYGDKTLADLRLRHVADNYTKSLSGGEKRRVSLGIELVTRPSILLIDEVTSGLDSHNAQVVMEVCRRIAQQLQMTVLLTIHQPNSEIFLLMDRVIVMHRGLCMYEGEGSKLSDYLGNKGYSMPDGYNAPDWALKVSQTESSVELNDKGFFDDVQPTDGPVLRQTTARLSSTVQVELPTLERVSLGTEIVELLHRDLTNIKRDTNGLLLHVLTVLIMAILLAVCCKGIAKDPLQSLSAFNSVVGIVYFIGFSCFVTLMLVVREACVRRPTFCREYLTGHYSMGCFMLTQLIIEVTNTIAYAVLYFLIIYWMLELQGGFMLWLLSIVVHGLVGSAIGHLLTSVPKDPYAALDLTPLIMSPQMLLCGFLVTPDRFPSYMQWVVWIPPLTYAFRLNLNIDLASLCGTGEETIARSACEDFLETQDATGENNPIYWTVLVCYLVIIRSLSFFFIRSKAMNL